MTIKKRSTRFGAAIILFALLLRMGGGITQISVHALRLPQVEQTVLRRGTGGVERGERETVTAPQLPTQPAPILVPVFSGEDLKRVQVRYASGCPYRPDLEAMLTAPLDWDLDSGEPAVLIVHTHGSEAFTKEPGQNYVELTDIRTLNTDYNMVAVGELLAQRLEAAGIRVIHDRRLHDEPSYNAAYGNARSAVQAYLAQYPSIQLVLDLHRDSATNPDGSEYATSATVDGKKIAQLMLVMGTDASGLHYPHWQDNFSVALKLVAVLEQRAPGISRTTVLRASRYNQDLHPAMLLIEVGSAGNTLTQAKGAVEILAQTIIALKNGANLAG